MYDWTPYQIQAAMVVSPRNVPSMRFARISLLTHDSPVKHWPQTSPDSERGSGHDRKPNVILCANAARQANKEARNRITKPDTNPRLPPRQTAHDHSTADHPGVDVERIGNPETDKVPRTPLASFGLNRFEIVVRQLWLCPCQLVIATGRRRDRGGMDSF